MSQCRINLCQPTKSAPTPLPALARSTWIVGGVSPLISNLYRVLLEDVLLTKITCTVQIAYPPPSTHYANLWTFVNDKMSSFQIMYSSLKITKSTRYPHVIWMFMKMRLDPKITLIFLNSRPILGMIRCSRFKVQNYLDGAKKKITLYRCSSLKGKTPPRHLCSKIASAPEPRTSVYSASLPSALSSL